MTTKTRGRQARGRDARYAAKHLLPRLALWAGVGVFICAPVPDYGDEANERLT